jgi:hypothetical protein
VVRDAETVHPVQAMLRRVVVFGLAAAMIPVPAVITDITATAADIMVVALMVADTAGETVVVAAMAAADIKETLSEAPDLK